MCCVHLLASGEAGQAVAIVARGRVLDALSAVQARIACAVVDRHAAVRRSEPDRTRARVADRVQLLTQAAVLARRRVAVVDLHLARGSREARQAQT